MWTDKFPTVAIGNPLVLVANELSTICSDEGGSRKNGKEKERTHVAQAGEISSKGGNEGVEEQDAEYGVRLSAMRFVPDSPVAMYGSYCAASHERLVEMLEWETTSPAHVNLL
jgi:hypothetical protein